MTVQNLISFHIVERQNSKNFLVWTYPTITDDLKVNILKNTFSKENHSGYLCWRKNNIPMWFHVYQQVDATSAFSIVLLSKEFQPNKYKILCDIMRRIYLKSHNPVELVELYLNLHTSGDCSLKENGTLYSCDFKNFKSDANLKGFIQSFDLEIILIYTAILLKRRILFFHKDTDLLFNALLSAINLIPCRNVEHHLYPNVEEVCKLKGLSFFVGGTTDSDVIDEKSMYDLFVNLQTREITVSPNAEEIMSMTKTHKEMATFLVKLSGSELSESEVMRHITSKTDDLFSMLKAIASATTDSDARMITINDLKSKRYHPTLENFLFNLAVAENIMML